MPRCGILSGNVVTKFRRLQLKVIFALLILFISVSFSMLQAQDASAAKPAAPDGAKTAAAPAPAAPTKDPVASSLRLSLARSQKNTLGAIAAMPADKFSYKPTPDQITFGHLVAHIAEANYFLCSKAADVPQPKVDEAKETDPKDKLLAAATASFDFAMTLWRRWMIPSWATASNFMVDASFLAPWRPLAYPAVGPITMPPRPCICG